MLTIPKHILKANIQSEILKYTWNDWQLSDIFDEYDKNLYTTLDEKLSQRAVLAYTTAVAEWVVFRYEKLSNDPIPLHHLDACWAGVADGRYFHYWEPSDENWTGSVRGPISMAIIFTIEAGVQIADDTHSALSAARITKIAEHILPNLATFNDWQSIVISRLLEYYSLNVKDTFGDVVPREIFDPSFKFNFDLEEIEQLVNNSLKSLDYEKNRFLNSPQEIIGQGFIGTPYTFSIKQDRENRADW